MPFLYDLPTFCLDVISWRPSVKNFIETSADEFQILNSLGIEGDTWCCMIPT